MKNNASKHFRPLALRYSHLALAALTTLAASAHAGTQVISNTFTIGTSGQSLGSFAGDSGFQGKTWDTSFGFGGYTDICALGICSGKTGLGVDVHSTGQVGFDVAARGSLGTVSAQQQYVGSLSITSAATSPTFSIATKARAATGSMSVTGATLQASLNGILKTTNSISAGACAFGACSSGSTNFNVSAGNFNILNFDTASSSKPLSLFGVALPNSGLNSPYELRESAIFGKGSGTGIQTPLLGTAEVFSPIGASFKTLDAAKDGGLEIKYLNPAFKTSLGLTQIAEASAGLSNDLLNPAWSGQGGVSVKGTLANASLTMTTSIAERIDLQTDLEVTMNFSTPVFQKVAGVGGKPDTWVSLGKVITVNAGTSLSDLSFNGVAGKLTSYDYHMGSDTKVSLNIGLHLLPGLALDAGCFDVDAPGGSLGFKCAYSGQVDLSTLPDVQLTSAAVGVSGWGTKSFTSGVDIPVAAVPVPEPDTYAMLLGGLACVGFVARRRAQPALG